MHRVINLDNHLQDIEREIVRERLQANAGNIGKSARELGVTRTCLDWRLDKLGLDANDYRKPKKPRKQVNKARSDAIKAGLKKRASVTKLGRRNV